MIYRGLTLLLAVVLLADMASAAESSGPFAGHTRGTARGDGPGVARFVCAHCEWMTPERPRSGGES